MMHVLHAEDDPEIAGVVQAFFNRYASESVVETVPTGSACLERMRQGGIDILLLDLVLPDITGLEVLGELSIRGDQTPVIMVSGHGQTNLAVKALRAGAVDCVEKGSPQFRQIVEIAKRHAQRSSKPVYPPAPEQNGKRRVLLIENSETHRQALIEFFAKHASTIELCAVPSAAGLDGFMTGADAVLIGSLPGGQSPLDLLRVLRSTATDLPMILLAPRRDDETAVAAFKLGAQDYILQKPDYLTELMYSLNHELRRAALSSRNTQLARELEAVNRSLEAQVETRTRELEALSMRLISVRDDERRTVARELHDQIGQMLTGLKFQLEAAASQAMPPVKEKLEEALVVATSLLASTRELILQLHPPILDDLGLQPAIEWHLNLFQRQTKIAVESEFSLSTERLPGELETTIFRIVQEALTNVARHSGSPTVHVTVTSDDLQVIVEITDRGCGFDLERARAKRNSLGLSSLTERARLAGGSVEIFSLPGRGTRVHASFPAPIGAQAS